MMAGGWRLKWIRASSGITLTWSNSGCFREDDGMSFLVEFTHRLLMASQLHMCSGNPRRKLKAVDVD